MKTIAKITQEISQVEKMLTEEKHLKAAETKLRKKLLFLLTCKMYIETNPSEAFL